MFGQLVDPSSHILLGYQNKANHCCVSFEVVSNHFLVFGVLVMLLF